MKHTQKGFTLVELAIVMTIIGLLIGGILKGQELMENARITSTISQIKAYEAAVTTFRDKFNAMPGDMPNAQNRLAGCTVAECAPASADAGDGIVGSPTWDLEANQAGSSFDEGDVSGETVLFWTHLQAADLIGGVSVDAANANLAWGGSYPSARLGGGFLVGYSNGANVPDGAPATAVPLNGTVLALAQLPQADLTAAANNLPVTPLVAAQLDRKMDDGLSSSGVVQAYGDTGNCFQVTGASTAYDETISARSCGLLFRIQG